MCLYYLYADDTLLMTSQHDPEFARQEMEMEIRKLQQWAHDNKIATNVGHAYQAEEANRGNKRFDSVP